MHKYNKITTDTASFLQISKSIADMPKSLYLLGNLPPNRDNGVVAIIGTRKPTTYGQEVTYRLSYELAAQGVIIVSGLALGVDSIAHKAALDAGGTTIAVLPTPLNKIHPRSHQALADRIVENGGALISEYSTFDPIFKLNFVARNRIVAAISDGVLITEAAIKSGTLHTANFALNYGKQVMAVPGNITSDTSKGTNNLIKTGAPPITQTRDVLDALGIRQKTQQQHLPLAENAQEATLLKLLSQGVRSGDDLILQSKLTPSQYNQTLTMLEIKGIIRPLGANEWTLA